jgi:hypothetical protein
MTALGFGAVSLTVAAYALEPRHKNFAIGCAASSAYGFGVGSLPFGGIEALWSALALQRFAVRRMM